MKKRKIPSGLAGWIEARRRHKLSHAQVQMARELGLNPRKLGGMDNHKQERWKLPLPQYIEELYRKRFHRDAPLASPSLEEVARLKEKKKAERRAAKAARRAAAAQLGNNSAPPLEYLDEVPF